MAKRKRRTTSTGYRRSKRTGLRWLPKAIKIKRRKKRRGGK